MAVKQLAFEQEARQALRRGVEKLAGAVKTTLGPRGRNAVIDKGWGSPTVTKDGVTVAEEVELLDKYENMGAQLVKEAASKTSEVAGDGTTTATVLAEAIFNEGLKNIAAGANRGAINRGIVAGTSVGPRWRCPGRLCCSCFPAARHRETGRQWHRHTILGTTDTAQ